MGSDAAEHFAQRLAMRCDRMRTELEQEGVSILGGSAYADPLERNAAQVDAIVLEEAVYARHAPVHEGLRPRYGSIVVPDISTMPEHLATDLRMVDGDNLASVRPMVDGATTILVRDLVGGLAILLADVDEELQLVDLLTTTKGVSVQRLDDGRMRIGTQDGVALNDGGDWSVRPSTGSVVRRLTRELALPENRVERMRELGGLLEFCFHSLSPYGIGATIIVNLQGPAEDLFKGLSDEGSTPGISLNVFDRDDQVLLKNMLASEDGACMVASDGSLTRYASKLSFTAQAAELVTEQGGTRHTSSKRFSFDNPGALAVVVSADGPITLFCGGSSLARIGIDDTEPSWRVEASKDLRARAEPGTHECRCGRCGVAYSVELVLDEEAGRERVIECVVCGNEVARWESAVHCRARVRRPWDPEGS